MPLEINMQEEKPIISVRTSVIAELIASIHMLTHEVHHEFDRDWVDSVCGSLSNESRAFRDIISKMNFPGLELFDFIIRTGIYDDIDSFFNMLAAVDELEFIYTVLNEEISIDRIKSVRADRTLFDEFMKQVPWSLNGSSEAIELLLYSTSMYKSSLMKLAREIYEAGFEERLKEHEDLYREAMASVKIRLSAKNPIDLAEEIKGAKVTARLNYKEYVFVPSYFLHHHNIISFDTNKFMLAFNINTDYHKNDEEIERISNILKVLSDKTRLEMLTHLKRRSTYGKVLAARLGLTTATISRHLEQLREINLVMDKKADNVKYFTVNKDEVEKILEELRLLLLK